ncbi:hypothetical protein [Bacteriovorax sp. Seq25_V]|uniref:hypothetical protein n=1 Tax=Bacteriovorax sp. Seq25_V TaxID=1201288 RepID=UPI00038A102D|nr:hypothetical protein [Bacteriovorax sp. Seq25_V]EQC44252.1 hypothetical protein M900_A0344 [Bacteriovorax sp. Seq25_V]
MKKIYLAAMLSVMLAHGAEASILEQLKPAHLKERIKEEFADLDVSLSLKLADIDIAEGVGISSKYKYEVEQSDIAGLHARIDKWNIKVDLRPGDILKDVIDFPIFLNINKGAEVHFVRQYEKKSEALKAIPYTLAKLPVTADHALKLHPGDFVSIPTAMSIITGVQASGLTNYIHADAKAYGVFSGEFLVHVFRMKDSKVRLKVIAQRSQNYGANTAVKFDYKLFGIGVLDKQVERVFDFKLADIGLTTGDGNQLIIDYVFDLSNEQAKKAYNNILGSSFKFRDVEIFREFLNERGLEDRLFATYELADQLATQDLEGTDKKRVERIFKGFNDYDKDTKKFKISLLLAKYDKNWTELENHISFDNDEGERTSYYYPTFTYRKEQKIGVGILSSKEKTVQTWFGLVPTKNADDWGDFSDFGITFDRKDQFFRYDEQVRFHQYLSDILPPVLFEKVDLGAWDKLDDKKGANTHVQVVIKREGFEQLKRYSQKEITQNLYDYYKNRKMVNLTFVDGFFKKLWKRLTLIKKDERSDIKEIGAKIYQFVNDEKLSGKERLQLIFDLRERSVFKKVGLAFMISLLDAESIEQNVYVNIGLGAKDMEKFEFSFGHQFNAGLYKQLHYVNRVLNDRSYDLRLTNEQISFKEESKVD